MLSRDEIDAALHAATQADDREALFAALAPLSSLLGQEREVAALWAEALRTSPSRPTLVEEARVILDAFPDDPAIVGSAGDALLRAEERRPVDEPPLAEGPASIAAAAAARCLAKRSAAERADPDLGGHLMALRGNALALLGPKRHADAVAALEAALALEERGAWRHDLAIAHKRARRFDAALVEAERARAQLGDHKPVLWNLAIAATAVGDGARAREAWTALGIPVEEGPGLPFVDGLEPAQVRLPTLGAGHELAPYVPDAAASFELVWVQPLSPCHGVVRSPTFREAQADFGDLVLWDGAPVTVTTIEGRPVPRFPFLGTLAKGDERRFRFLALQQASGEVEALGAALTEGAILYRHGERVERVCPRCAAGDAMVAHEHLPAEEHRVAFGKILVPGDRDLEAFAAELEAARRAHPGVLLAVPALYEALGRTKEAGAHHKRWGTIERTRPRALG